MRKYVIGFLLFGFTLLPAYLSYAEKAPRLCCKLTGHQTGCVGPTATLPCNSTPPPGAGQGAKCGTHYASFSSPQWDEVVGTMFSPGYYIDWETTYTCSVEYDCTVQPGFNPGSFVCAIDLMSEDKTEITKTQLNFNDPCNMSP